MSQPADQNSVGYALKRAQAALHTAMEAALDELGIGVSQYSCLTALRAHPEISNAELARAVFVSRQATHQLLAGLQQDGLVTVSGTGRGARLSLTSRGRELLAEAATRVDAVEHRMLTHIPVARRAALREELALCARSLEPTAEGTRQRSS